MRLTNTPDYPENAPEFSPKVPTRSSPPESNEYNFVFSIQSTQILKYLVITTAILLALHIVAILSYRFGIFFPGKVKFYFDRESNVPSYFSSVIILITASILGFIAALKRKEQDSFARHWFLLALIFLALSVDEAVSFHEFLIDPLRNKFELSGLLRFSWVILGGLFLLIFGFSYLRFFLALSKTMKRLFFLSGAVYVLGVIGFEMIGGYFFVSFEDFSQKSLPYMVVMTIEETLEISGILLFIYTLLLYLKTYAPKINLIIK